MLLDPLRERVKVQLIALIIFRIATVALMTAFKFICETNELLPNSNFATLLDVSCDSLLEMEIQFCHLLEFKLYVSKAEFETYQKDL
jgi:hypothetical protein